MAGHGESRPARAGGSTPRFIADLDTLRARRSLKWAQGAPDPRRIRLTVAEMDIETPAFLLPVLGDALRSGETGYADTAEQERACRRFLSRHHGAEAAAVRCTTDVLAGIRTVLRAALPPRSPVILETPVYGDLFSTVREAGCVPLAVPLHRDPGSRRYVRDWDGLRAAVRTGGARAWIHNQPHNPIGQVWDGAETARTTALAIEHDLLLVANEVHLPLGLRAPVPSLLAAPAAHEARVVGLTSASKAFNVPGLKSASVYASARSARFLRALPQGLLGRPGILGALATAACYDLGDSWLAQLRAELGACVDTVLAGLRNLPVPVTVLRPQATYLVWAEIGHAQAGRFRAALEDSHVAMSAGPDFGGTAYEAFFRINAAAHPEVLAAALRSVGDALRNLPGRHP